MATPSQLAVSQARMSFLVALVLLGLIQANADAPSTNPCTDSQYWDGSSCASCVPFSTTDDESFTGADSCLCNDDYYHDSLTGACVRCPSSTSSTRGANYNISDCDCNLNWVGSDGLCESCGPGGYAAYPENTALSDCTCKNNWYGIDGTCTACPQHARSVRGSNQDFSSCECQSNYWGLGGGSSDFCTRCGLSSTSIQGSNAENSSCVCKKNYFGSNGDCRACPEGARATPGQNSEASDCICPTNWYLDAAGTKCERCSSKSRSVAGENNDISSCQCIAGFYGTNGDCEKCPPHHTSVQGDNADLSDCRCKDGYYGTTGDCQPCPGRSMSVGPGNTDLASCNLCDPRYYGNPVLTPRTNNNGYTVTNCTRCEDEQHTTLPGSNTDETGCYCPATARFYEDGGDDNDCAKCPGKTRVRDPQPGEGLSSCACLDRAWYGPVESEGGLDCMECEPFSKIDADVNAAGITSKGDCECAANYYRTPGETCTKCPAFTAAPKDSPDYYVSKSAQGSTEVFDCTCPADFFGPVAKKARWAPASAWINEFRPKPDGFVEIITLDGESPQAGYELILLRRLRKKNWKIKKYDSITIEPVDSGLGYTVSYVDTKLMDRGGIMLKNKDNGDVVEFFCYGDVRPFKKSGTKCKYIDIDPSRPAEASVQRIGSDAWDVFGVSDTKGQENEEQVLPPPTEWECRRCPDKKPFSVKGSNADKGSCLCPDNWYINSRTRECEPCPANSVSTGTNKYTVLSCVCKDDFFMEFPGVCERCPNGGHSVSGSNYGESSCHCAAGYYGTSTSNCQRCPDNGKSEVGTNDDVSGCSCGQNMFGLNAGAGCEACPTGTKTVSFGLGINVLEDSCSCPAGEYGPGYGDCQTCPDGTTSRAGYNFEVGACACPDDSYGPGVGHCQPCPSDGTSVTTYNTGVYSCQCPEGFAMSYMHFVGGVKQPPSCVPSASCDGILDMVSGKCWKLLRDKTRTWDEADLACQAWETPNVPDDLVNDPNYVPTPGHLASIVTREDLELGRIIFDDFGYERGKRFWTGANDRAQEGTWEWSDGSTFAFVQEMWAPNQPSNNAGENCVGLYKNWKEPGTNQHAWLFNDGGCASKNIALCSKSPNFCISGNNDCSPNAECVDRDFGLGYFGYNCECHFGFFDSKGDGTECVPADVSNCNASNECSSLSYCHVYDLDPTTRICSCSEGMIGDGVGAAGCDKNGYTVRAVVELPDIMPDVDIVSNDKLAKWPYCKESMARLFFDADASRPTWFADAMHHHITGSADDGYVLTLNGLFTTKEEAEAGMAAFNRWKNKGVYACTAKIEAVGSRRNLGPDERSIVLVSPDTVLSGTPGVYTWTTGTTGDPLQIAPTGFEVEAVFFDTSCMATGCWVVDVIYTRGTSNFVSFFLPHALRPNGDGNAPLLPGESDLSVDYDYDVIPAMDTQTDLSDDGIDYWYAEWHKSPETTFQPRNFPCGSDDYDPASSPGENPPMKMTACCIMEFRQTYRPVKAFFDATEGIIDNCRPLQSALLTGDRAWNTADPVDPNAGPGATFATFSPSDQLPADGLGAAGDDGLFAGMELSRIDPTGVVDPFIGIHRARVRLDEVELRERAGKLTGTVGVEHVVDTFLGLAEFKPTGTGVLDSFATQTAIHLEKTSFFTVSTHGTNAYTFLEYVNLRLVAVYDEDTNPTETVGENGNRTERTDSTGAAHYVQVTFTLGSQYRPIETGLVPSDSVRVGQGSFMASAFTDKTHATPGLFHACDAYADELDALLLQTCAPNAAMCVSPADTPDAFVVYNIPLGIDWLPGPQSDLGQSVFVDMVVSAIDVVATGTPNSGDAPEQMKTTLTASIPVVEGGVNIFCDGVTAKTDLVDVVQVNLIIGSAAGAGELTRLRIFTDIASSDLTPKPPSEFATDSIEAGLMTLVVKGNRDYFEQPGTSGYRVNVEDVITVHIMEPASTKYDAVQALLATPGQDNHLQAGLDTDGYLLNGAFKFSIDRSAQRAHLEPSEALLGECSFNPARPSASVPFPTTCVLRRDIFQQGYPNRNGAFSTAVEVPPKSEGDRHANSMFMTTILGDSDYAYDLGGAFSQLVADTYDLDGRYKRAFMVNPGYEWTPTQTGGAPLFSLSQKILLFALVNLDEAFAPPIPASYTLPATRANPNNAQQQPRRRVLLSSTAQTGAGMAGAELAFDVSPKALLANALGLTLDRVAVLAVSLALSLEEACLPADARVAALTQRMEAHVAQAASHVQQVVVLSAAVDMAGHACPPPARRSAAAASAALEVLVAFPAGKASHLDLQALAALDSVLSARGIDVSPKVQLGEVPDAARPATWGGSGQPQSGGGGGGGNTALMGGVAGGVGGAVLLAGGLFLVLRWRSKTERADVDVATAASANYDSLKAQLQEDV